MQLVRAAQSKHKINLLALSMEDGEPYVVATWYVVLIVPLNSNTNTSSHSPRRKPGPQAPASGNCTIVPCALQQTSAGNKVALLSYVIVSFSSTYRVKYLLYSIGSNRMCHVLPLPPSRQPVYCSRLLLYARYNAPRMFLVPRRFECTLSIRAFVQLYACIYVCIQLCLQLQGQYAECVKHQQQ